MEYNKTTINFLLDKYDFHIKKNLGQNFLIDQNIITKIVDSLNITKDDVIIEVGPGLGALTHLLAEKAYKVYAIDIDKKACEILNDSFIYYDNVNIVNEDYLKVDVYNLIKEDLKNNKNIKFVSNLPYYITSKIIMFNLENKYPFSQMVIMLQKEVAERMNAGIGAKDYSVFTICLDYFAETQKLFDVSRNVFYPKPNVDSAVVKLLPRKTPKVKVLDEKTFFKVVKAAFANRRKMIFNSMANSLGINKDILKEALSNANIEETLRAENISIESFANLSDEIYKIKRA